MRTPVVFLALMPLTGGLARAAEPELVLRPSGLILRHLPSILSEETVARQMDTGLTTSFVFSVDAGRESSKGVAQVRIRYDLWDERYVIERWDSRPSLTSLAKPQLGAWWRALELVVVSGLPPVPPGRAKVTLRVLPFSQAEQRDAQDWLLRSFQTGGGRDAGRGGSGPPAGGEAAPLRNVYSSMLAASIGQRTLITYSWTVAVTTEPR